MTDRSQPLQRRYFNRELSWVRFNDRVLEEAGNPNNPLFERLRFLSITDSNFKEFYMVRVAGLKAQVSAHVQNLSPEGRTAAEQLEEIHARATDFIARQTEVWLDLKKQLEEQGIFIVRPATLTPSEKRWLEKYFLEQVFPILTPLAVDPAHPFPFIPNLGFSIVLELEDKKKSREPMMTLVPVPTRSPRFIRVKSEGQTKYVLLEDLILAFMDRLMPDFTVKASGLFNIIRDSELEVKEDAEDLSRSLETALKKRRRGHVIRLIINKGMPKRMARFISEQLHVEDADLFERTGIMRLTDVKELITEERPHLLFPPFSTRFPERIRDFGGDCFAAIRDKDFIVHHPYESFDVVVQFLRQAARDPHVVTIKQTLYRTSDDSPIVKALMEAAEAGKSVTALVELAARFDEEANIRWARDMERAGVHVVYGFLRHKTHAKVSLVARREDGQLRSYVHFGTGNYHPYTAKVYTDLSFFTCAPEMCRDAARLFNYLTGYAEPKKMERLAFAPKTLRKRILEMIDQEITHVKARRPGQIWAKMNALLDREVIDKLYEASQAGVQIDLVVRGICALRPGVKGLSENIRVKSIVGRFLEHSRIVCFGNGHGLPSDQSLVFISSADWMPRNFDWRVEVLVPMVNETVHRQVQDQIMMATLLDNTNSWRLKPSGEWVRIKPGKKPFSAHQYFMENPSLSGRGSALHTQPLPPKLKLGEGD